MDMVRTLAIATEPILQSWLCRAQRDVPKALIITSETMLHRVLCRTQMYVANKWGITTEHVQCSRHLSDGIVSTEIWHQVATTCQLLTDHLLSGEIQYSHCHNFFCIIPISQGIVGFQVSYDSHGIVSPNGSSLLGTDMITAEAK